MYIKKSRGHNSVGRVPALHADCRRFEPYCPHHHQKEAQMPTNKQPKTKRIAVAQKVLENIGDAWPMTDAEKQKFIKDHASEKRAKKNSDCIDW